jgi:Fe-S-cluster containining protein
MKKELPCWECGGRCCTHAPFHMKEWLKIKERFPVGEDAVVEEVFVNSKAHGVVVSKKGTNKQCYFLHAGRCSIYTYRPTTCRKTGADGVCAYINPEAVMKKVMEMKSRGHVFLSEKDS